MKTAKGLIMKEATSRTTHHAPVRALVARWARTVTVGAGGAAARRLPREHELHPAHPRRRHGYLHAGHGAREPEVIAQLAGLPRQFALSGFAY